MHTHDTGTAAPEKSTELKKPAKAVQELAAALASKSVLTKDEWKAFGVKRLRIDQYVRLASRGCTRP